MQRFTVPVPAVLVLVGLLLFSACAPQPQVESSPTAAAAVEPTATPSAPAPTAAATQPPAVTPTAASAAAQSDFQIIRAVQATMNGLSRALRTNDSAKLVELVDQDNRAFRRTMNEYLDQWQQVGYNRRNVNFIVRGITRKPNDYVMARITSSDLGEMTWIFRYVDGIWRVSEPLDAELGAIKVKENGKYRLRYYEWDEPLISRYEKIVDTMYQGVLDRMKLPYTETLTVSIWPTMATFPGVRQFSLGGVRASADHQRNNINMRGLDMFGAGTWDEGESPDDSFMRDMQHEFVHIVHGKFIPLGNMPNWMTEGLAEYISGNRQDERLRLLLQTRRLFGLQALHKAFYFASLRPLGSETTADTVNIEVQGYNESESIVRYIAETYGIDKFYALNAEYVASRDIDASFRKVLGSGIVQVERDWVAWMIRYLFGAG